MHGVITENPVFVNPGIGINTLIAMYKTVERNIEQQQTMTETKNVNFIKEEVRLSFFLRFSNKTYAYFATEIFSRNLYMLFKAVFQLSKFNIGLYCFFI